LHGPRKRPSAPIPEQRDQRRASHVPTLPEIGRGIFAPAAVSSSEATTQGIRVEVESEFSPPHSSPAQWFFLYTIRISNHGSDTVQLISRHWIIRDASGRIEEVKGPGVIGDQPILEPGDSYEYTSGCPLPTPFGSMRGTYQMVTEDGAQFDAEIAEFLLREPGAIH
jgi:ApaG protein